MLLLIHAAATLLMTGIIWFVQVVHYPAYRQVPAQSFTAYQVQHTRTTGWVVLPLMLTELACALWLAWSHGGIATVGLALLALIWLSTFGLQVPLHQRLSQRRSEADIERLISTNWIRTLLWTGRALIALALLQPAASA